MTPTNKQRTGDVAGAGHTIWLAGLGALAEAERSGREVFDDLVARGRRVETEQFKALDRTVARAAEGAERLSEAVSRTLNEGVRGILHRASLPTREDLNELSARLDRLAERLDTMGRH
ncbi:MAG TPA: phasin family protein [Thermoanaerobaculia bacterium]|nr:phasin family protein [Thermoanaerobaculia bacterium]